MNTTKKKKVKSKTTNMSYTEFHSGKLKRISAKMSFEDLKEFVEKDENLEIDDLEYYEDEEALDFLQIVDKRKRYKDDGRLKYISHKGILYEVLNHKGGEFNEDLNETIENSDGTIDFRYIFYNGGTCFTEMLEEGLDNLK